MKKYSLRGFSLSFLYYLKAYLLFNVGMAVICTIWIYLVGKYELKFGQLGTLQLQMLLTQPLALVFIFGISIGRFFNLNVSALTFLIMGITNSLLVCLDIQSIAFYIIISLVSGILGQATDPIYKLGPKLKSK